MKNAKVLWKFAVLFVLAFSLTNCGDGKQKPSEEDSKEEHPNGEHPNGENTPVMVKAPEQIIEPDEAKKLFDNYGDRRVPLIQKYEAARHPSEKFEAARYVSYDIDTLKQYIAFVEQQALDAKVKVKSLRIYFANYPDDAIFQHPRQNSIMILPTTTDITGTEAGFYTTDDGEGERKALTIRSLFPKKGNAKGMGLHMKSQQKSHASLIPNFFAPSPLFQGDQSLILNRGHGSPPPKNESDF